MEQNHREANSLLPNNQEDPRIFTVFAVTRFLSLFWARWVQSMPYNHVFKIYFNITLSTSTTSVGFFTLGLFFPCAFKIPRIRYPQWFDHINIICWVQIMKFPIMEFSPRSLDWSYYHSYREITRTFYVLKGDDVCRIYSLLVSCFTRSRIVHTVCLRNWNDFLQAT